MRKINRIILHYLGVASSWSFVGQSAVDRIRRMHINENRWLDIGYHHIVDRNGSRFIGRPENIQGAHASGHNYDTIAVLVMYGTIDTHLTKETINSLTDLISDISKRHSISINSSTLLGHQDLMPTQCPGIVQNEIPNIIKRLTLPVDNGKIKIEGLGGQIVEGILIDNQSYMRVRDFEKLIPDYKISWHGPTKTVRIERK